MAESSSLAQIPTLLRGDAPAIQVWLGHWSGARICLYVGVTMAGAALFGATVGSWRDPLQGLYNAVKFPAIVLLTALGNGLLNGMLAPLLGTNLHLRQSLLAVLMSFTIAAVVLGACSPLVGFMIWNSPPLSAQAAESGTTHGLILVTVVAVIALAGIAANLKLLRLLERESRSLSSARRTLFAWLAGNLLLGSQISWILRPFVGSPSLPVQFIRDDALHGNFFEALGRILHRLFS